jgi:hypothetical protein
MPAEHDDIVIVDKFIVTAGELIAFGVYELFALISGKVLQEAPNAIDVPFSNGAGISAFLVGIAGCEYCDSQT